MTDGGLTGHPDHRHTHRVTVLAAYAAGLEHLYPGSGLPWRPRELYLGTHPTHSALPALREIIGTRRAAYAVPDAEVTDRLDVTPWLDAKVAAVLAHRTEVERGALPGLVAGLSPDLRAPVCPSGLPGAPAPAPAAEGPDPRACRPPTGRRLTCAHCIA